MKVCEIFASIQGESAHAGLPCVFVRLTGCNLRCAYCDTAYAYEEGIDMTVDSVVSAVGKYGFDLVEITGGEPLLQADALELASRLLDAGFRVLIETNGSTDIGRVDKRAIVIMDVKTPGSGAADSVCVGNFDFLKKKDELKFVLCDRADYEWSVNFVRRHSLLNKCAVLFSPAYGRLDPAELSGWILEDRLPVRLNLQLHKYIFNPDRRGV
ncbi:MAG TPA: radical SAM protein [Dissulfurispiraceae bacterium]|nr:radical SAM protein [Dissulfurispiraceae bacterium]